MGRESNASGLAGLLPLIVGYAICSSLLLVANKWALNVFPKTNLLMFCQFITSYGVVAVMALTKLVECDALEVEKVKQFVPVVFIFYAVLWSNMRALAALGVDLVILFRSLTPFAISIGDYIYLGRAMPSLQSWFALVTMTLCTAFIFVREPQISLAGVLWGLLYYAILSVDMVYLKKITVDVKLTTYGRVVYTNLIAAPPALLLAFAAGEFKGIWAFGSEAPAEVFYAVGSTCVLGYGMSYLSWALRAKVSALTFVVIGILCKIGSIIINALFMNQHLGMQSMVLVCLGITASTLYEQPKARAGQVDVNKADEDPEARGKSQNDGDGHDMAPHDKPKEPPLSKSKIALMVSLTIAIFAVHYGDKILALAS
ncbi:GDP-fucose transporter 1 [Porphyridium purpureum]|uniref:GDP-fucose transporter 1 n=1 Tax=Porphyridium purpureum TaxID=35688 RepID=A0A5J4YP43_PORPP|nr:GDP-fucose transporter 1 [Porphyridium purpureum]|eukprot:POR8831..scf222_8